MKWIVYSFVTLLILLQQAVAIDLKPLGLSPYPNQDCDLKFTNNSVNVLFTVDDNQTSLSFNVGLYADKDRRRLITSAKFTGRVRKYFIDTLTISLTNYTPEFRDAPIYIYLDSSSEIAESDETNNLLKITTCSKIEGLPDGSDEYTVDYYTSWKHSVEFATSKNGLPEIGVCVIIPVQDKTDIDIYYSNSPNTPINKLLARVEDAYAFEPLIYELDDSLDYYLRFVTNNKLIIHMSDPGGKPTADCYAFYSAADTYVGYEHYGYAVGASTPEERIVIMNIDKTRSGDFDIYWWNEVANNWVIQMHGNLKANGVYSYNPAENGVYKVISQFKQIVVNGYTATQYIDTRESCVDTSGYKVGNQLYCIGQGIWVTAVEDSSVCWFEEWDPLANNWVGPRGSGMVLAYGETQAAPASEFGWRLNCTTPVQAVGGSRPNRSGDNNDYGMSTLDADIIPAADTRLFRGQVFYLVTGSVLNEWGRDSLIPVHVTIPVANTTIRVYDDANWPMHSYTSTQDNITHEFFMYEKAAWRLEADRPVQVIIFGAGNFESRYSMSGYSYIPTSEASTDPYPDITISLLDIKFVSCPDRITFKALLGNAGSPAGKAFDVAFTLNDTVVKAVRVSNIDSGPQEITVDFQSPLVDLCRPMKLVADVDLNNEVIECNKLNNKCEMEWEAQCDYDIPFTLEKSFCLTEQDSVVLDASADTCQSKTSTVVNWYDIQGNLLRGNQFRLVLRPGQFTNGYKIVREVRCGGSSCARFDTITVLVADIPEPILNAPDSVCIGQTVIITQNPRGCADYVRWFVDNYEVQGFDNELRWTAVPLGLHKITVLDSCENTCKGSTSIYIEVISNLPLAIWETSRKPCENEVCIKVQSGNSSRPASRFIIDWEGNARYIDTTTTGNACHAYLTKGTYPIIIFGEDLLNCNGIDTFEVEIPYDLMSLGSLTSYSDSCLSYGCMKYPGYGGKAPYKWYWDFDGNPGLDTTTYVDTVCTYFSENKDFNVWVRVEDEQGCYVEGIDRFHMGYQHDALICCADQTAEAPANYPACVIIPGWMKIMCEGWVDFYHFREPNVGLQDTLTGEVIEVIKEAYFKAVMDPTLDPINSELDNYPSVHRLLGYTRDGVQIEDFSQQIQLSISYKSGYSQNVPESKFVICRLDSAKAKWVPLDSTWVDERFDLVHGMIENFHDVYAVLAYYAPESVCSNFGNFPNPFQAGRENTKISYVLQNYAAITIDVYTIMGSPVAHWEFDYNDPMGRGNSMGIWHTLEWDGRNTDGRALANGAYVGMLIATDINGGILCEERTLIGVAK